MNVLICIQPEGLPKLIFCHWWCKREHIVLPHKTPVNPHFPSVSKINPLIRLPSLISCLWDHKNWNFIGGWFPQALPVFLSAPVSLYLVLSLLSSSSPFSSPSTVVITVSINTEHQWKKKKKKLAASNWSYQGHPLDSAEENKTDKRSTIT